MVDEHSVCLVHEGRRHMSEWCGVVIHVFI